MSTSQLWKVRLVTREDELAWKELFRGYRDFYLQQPNEEVVQTVWEWAFDDSRELTSFVATDTTGKVVGIANTREFPRNLAGGKALWLDDLYSNPEYRGQGIGTSLLEFLKSYAKEHSLLTVRWITAEDNLIARKTYDQIAVQTSWVTYDMAPE